MKSLCLVVPKKDGEKVRKRLLVECALRTNLMIERKDDLLLFPISKSIDIGYEIKEMEFRSRFLPPKDYKELVDLPADLEELLPSSMDIIGDIVVFRLPQELEEYKHIIGRSMAIVNNAKTVVIDRGVEGDMRLRNLELLVGEDTFTVHTEFGLSYELEVDKVYFSPRLSAERHRIANLVKDGEVIIDMFCGVGPFSIMIAKHSNPKKIYAIDINPTAIKYLRSNITLNGVDGIAPLIGDAKEIVNSIEKCDRIIMNLPLSSFQFFETALSAVKDNGVIHYYEILIRKEVSERIDQLKENASRFGKDLEINMKEVKSYSATKAHFAFDLEVRV